jgi:multidrug efflux system membrane fusion protein
MHSSSPLRTLPRLSTDRHLSQVLPRRQGQSGKALPWVLALVLLVGAGAGWKVWSARQAGAGPAAGPGPGGPKAGGRRFGDANRAQPVSVDKAQLRDLHVTVNAIGTLQATSTATVHVQATGVLQSVAFKEGQQVRAGQTLAQIDPRSFQAALGQAQGALARDQALLSNAQLDLKRYQGLMAKDAIAQQQVDTQQALVRQLAGTVAVDQAAVDTAKLQLSYTRVLAPISGRVGLRQVDPGNVVQPADANGLVVITQTHPMALVFAVPSAQLPKISARLKARLPLPVQAWDRDQQALLASGQVATTDNQIDSSTDTIKLKALFDNHEDTLFPNQSVSVRLQVETLPQTLVVPQAAVLRGAQGFYVYVVQADQSVSTKTVVPGAVDGTWMAVSGAVRPGDTIVVDGVDRLREGAKVEVIASDPNQRVGAQPPARGASGGMAGSRGGMGNLSPEDAAKVQAMSPDERRAWFQARRAAREAGGAGGSTAASGASR